LPGLDGRNGLKGDDCGFCPDGVPGVKGDEGGRGLDGM
jgi:hypothetical protein